MTTKGRARRDTTGALDWLRDLPAAVGRSEAEGRPIVVELPPTLDPAVQRLLAELGVLVRFLDPD